MKILITAFDPFGGETVNPAFEAVKRLPDMIDGAEIVKLQVPTLFKASIKMVTRAIDEIKPDVCLSIGQAGGRFDITVERVAINVDDGRIPDNAGYQPVDEPVDPAGLNAYFATLPIKAMVEGIRQQGIPASVSNSAGTYVCNHLMYGVLNHIHQHNLKMRAGFMHIPFLPEQVVGKPSNVPSMGVQTILRAIETAIKVIVATQGRYQEVGRGDPLAIRAQKPALISKHTPARAFAGGFFVSGTPRDGDICHPADL